MAVLLAIVIWLIAAALSYPFIAKTWWAPDPITVHARQVDDQLALTFIVTGVIFVLAHIALGLAVFKFGTSGGRADSVHGNNRMELLWTSAATVLFVGLTFMGYTAWAETRFAQDKMVEPSPDRGL
jgi:heme/copper-type cytochrome/quinol oxidase subunit 2